MRARSPRVPTRRRGSASEPHRRSGKRPEVGHIKRRPPERVPIVSRTRERTQENPKAPVRLALLVVRVKSEERERKAHGSAGIRVKPTPCAAARVRLEGPNVTSLHRKLNKSAGPTTAADAPNRSRCGVGMSR